MARTGSPLGFPGPGATTHPSAQTMAHWRKVAHCMRQHGVPRFPNPTTSVSPNLLRIGEVSDRDGAILAIPATINMQSATFTRATTACGFMADYTTLVLRTTASARRHGKSC